jgi:hypothetical protein
MNVTEKLTIILEMHLQEDHLYSLRIFSMLNSLGGTEWDRRADGQTDFCDSLYRDIFNAIDDFTALRFTAIGLFSAAKGIRILPMTQHA